MLMLTSTLPCSFDFVVMYKWLYFLLAYVKGKADNILMLL